MTNQQKEKIGGLYDRPKQRKRINSIEEEEEIKRRKAKEREKRIKQKKTEQKTKIDFDTETVIGMTNRNNQNKRREEQRKIAKKQEQIEKKKKKIKKILKSITLFSLIIGGIVFLLVSPIFNIKEIEIINNNRIAQETIISLSQLEVGQNLFRFSKNKVEKEIKTNPYVQNVKIKRKFPNKIEITIEERNRNYNVEFLNGYVYINNQGYILEISEEKLDLPVILGISTPQEQIVEGNRLNTEDLEKLEIVIQIMNICKNYELDQKVSSINIEDKSNYIIYMEEEKKTIHLGDSNDLNNKMLYIPATLEECKEKEGDIYIDKDTINKFKARFREKV